jgi:hypothetical protein
MKWYILGQDHRRAADAVWFKQVYEAAGHTIKLKERPNGDWNVMVLA